MGIMRDYRASSDRYATVHLHRCLDVDNVEDEELRECSRWRIRKDLGWGPILSPPQLPLGLTASLRA